MNSRIQGNTAAADGGGAAFQLCQAVFEDSLVENNQVRVVYVIKLVTGVSCCALVPDTTASSWCQVFWVDCIASRPCNCSALVALLLPVVVGVWVWPNYLLTLNGSDILTAVIHQSPICCHISCTCVAVLAARLPLLYSLPCSSLLQRVFMSCVTKPLAFVTRTFGMCSMYWLCRLRVVTTNSLFIVSS